MTNINWGPTGQLVYERTYSRTKANGEKETWPETVERVVDGNLALVDSRYHMEGERDALIAAMRDFKILPAGRHLWASGVEGRQYLFNCLAYETEIVTSEGIYPIGDLEGQTIKVRDGNGRWVETVVQSYGVQPLRKVTWRNGKGPKKVVYATGNHRWKVAKDRKGATEFVTTDELKPGYSVAKVGRSKGPMPELSPVGVQAGFIFGDGTRNEHGSIAYFCGDKDKALLEWFGNVRTYDRGDGVLVTPHVFPRSFKERPSLSEGASFLYGWLAGYFAADGAVSNGTPMLYSADREDLEHARSVAARLGIGTQPIRTYSRQGYGDSESNLVVMSFDPTSLESEFFLVASHREAWAEKNEGKRNRSRWTVESVEETDRVEEVFCVVVPTTHTFVLADGLLTGNCHVSGWGAEVTDHFEFTFMRLMEGGGVGSNYSNRFLEQYPQVQGNVTLKFCVREDHPDVEKLRAEGVKIGDSSDNAMYVEDSREGWADALVTLIRTHYEDGPERALIFDVSKVREEGAPLKTFGGHASGPAPLVRMLTKINDTLNERSQERLTGMDAMLIDHYIAECVVAGGNRRSARMAIMHWYDAQIDEFLDCKKDGKAHWTTNISVEVDSEFWKDVQHPGAHASYILKRIAEGMHANGEPGFWDSDYSNVGEPNEVIATNPCGEIALEAWENCNLGHVNLAAFVAEDGELDYEGLSKAHTLMTRFLMRATYGDVTSAKQAEKLARNRRIGVGHFGFASMLGLMGIRYADAPFVSRVKDMLSEMREVVRRAATSFAHDLRIPVPVKMTTVAPTGTIAKLPGVSEGIHPIFAKYFIRRVRFSTLDAAQADKCLEMMNEGYHVEPDAYAENTMVVSIPTQDSLMAEVIKRYGLERAEDIVQSAGDLTLKEMLEVQALYQTYWSDNAVSYTANFDPEKYDVNDIMEAIVYVGRLVKGATLFPERGFVQPPYERITRAEYEAYGNGSVADSVDESCATGACPVK